jgi:hypothetical protein
MIISLLYNVFLLIDGLGLLDFAYGVLDFVLLQFHKIFTTFLGQNQCCKNRNRIGHFDRFDREPDLALVHMEGQNR